MPEINTIILLAGLAVNLILMAVGGTWKLSRVEMSLHKYIDQSKKDTEERVERQKREFGETVAAIRAGVNLDMTAIRKEISEEQKFTRDTFMRRESFYKVQETLQQDFRALGAELKGRLDRLDAKIDTKT